MRVSSEIGYHIGAPRCAHFTLIPCRAGTALASSGGIEPHDDPDGGRGTYKKASTSKIFGRGLSSIRLPGQSYWLVATMLARASSSVSFLR